MGILRLIVIEGVAKGSGPHQGAVIAGLADGIENGDCLISVLKNEVKNFFHGKLLSPPF